MLFLFKGQEFVGIREGARGAQRFVESYKKRADRTSLTGPLRSALQLLAEWEPGMLQYMRDLPLRTRAIPLERMDDDDDFLPGPEMIAAAAEVLPSTLLRHFACRALRLCRRHPKRRTVASSDAVGGRDSTRSGVYPVLLAVIALGFDAADRRVPFSILATGLLDQPAHLATAALGLLVLACFIEAPRRFYVAALVASMAIPVFSSGLAAERCA